MMMQRFQGFEDLLDTQSRSIPGLPALMYAAGEGKAVLSYREFRGRCQERRDELAASGGSCLGVLCDGSLECVLTVFGSVLAGMQTVLLDENAPEELLGSQIRRTDVDTLWGSDGELTEELTKELTPAQVPAAGTGTLPARERTGRILFFTSGTTEAGKAVVLTDASLMSSAWNGSCMLPLAHADRLLCVLPLNHVFGFVCSLLWGLQCGACVALGRGMRHYTEDPAFFAPTVISLVPMLLGFLMKQKALNPQLTQVLIGAGDCPKALPEALRALHIRVSFGYGLTETSSGVAISTGGDPFAMEICPDPEITLADDGEVLIKAPSVMMQGYYKDPASTQAALRAGILHTGDLGRLDEDGRLHITGRKKEILVLSDGTKIFLPEYEARIRAILGDTDMAVIAPDQAPVLVLYGEQAARAQIREKLSPLMALYPRGQQLKDILFLTEPLPRTATGKVRRWELLRKLSQAGPE